MAIRLPTIKTPCTRDFEAMPGDEKTRFCDECGKHVHDLSARTEAEARAFLAGARGTRVCLRIARDVRGVPRFRAVAVAAAVSLAACTTPAPVTPVAPPADDSTVDREMGDAVPDVDDRCPDDPAADTDDGCPDPDAKPVEI